MSAHSLQSQVTDFEMRFDCREKRRVTASSCTSNADGSKVAGSLSRQLAKVERNKLVPATRSTAFSVNSAETLSKKGE